MLDAGGWPFFFPTATVLEKQRIRAGVKTSPLCNDPIRGGSNAGLWGMSGSVIVREGDGDGEARGSGGQPKAA